MVTRATDDPARDDVAALMATSKLLTAIVAHTLADAHAAVTTPQLRILVMIAAQGEMNLSSVARGLGVNASNASRTCEQLVVGGLLSRDDDPADRRNVVLSTTTSGEQLVQRLMDLRRELFERVADTMSAEDRNTLASGLQAFLRSAAAVAAADQEDSDFSDGDGHLLRWLA